MYGIRVKVIFLRKVYNDNCIYGFFLIAPVIYKSTVLSGPKCVPCMVDLRRYIDIKDSYGYSNHVGFMISRVDRLDDDPKVTALKVKAYRLGVSL